MIKKNLTPSILIRIMIYLLIWCVYLWFMKINAPLGIDWLEWHFQRIYNFSEYLKINGYFLNYGFSIWSSCDDCSLNKIDWKKGIYLSQNIFTHSPYIIINHFFGKIGLSIIGPLLDKSIIFLSGVILAEIVFKYFKFNSSIFFKNIISLAIFILFVANPWTYKMILASWYLVYFLFFILLGLLFILQKRYTLSLFAFFLSALFSDQAALIIVVYYLILYLIFKLHYKLKFLRLDDFTNKLKPKIIERTFYAFLIPVLGQFLLRFFAKINLSDSFLGSSILYRIGISGNDIHNGGIIGAFQFLGGNRITNCLSNSANLEFLYNPFELNKSIQIYNCFLSTISMYLVSLISIYGIIIFYKKFKDFRFFIAPVSFLLIFYIMILQQSLSVHLMGYSYIFSLLFSLGISSIIIEMSKINKFIYIKSLILFPLFVGIILLSIRISMMTGSNG